jgi:hypothetical protein
MPSLLSGSTLRRGGSGEFIELANAQPQLPATDTTLTGFTLVTNSLLQTSYRSSLGFVEFTTGSMYSALPEGAVRILATGTTFLSTNTYSGNLIVEGGVGIGGNIHVEEDIVVNGLTIGRGYEGVNNIVIKGTAAPQVNDFLNGQETIVIGYDALTGLLTSYKNIAVGRYALNSGTELSSSIAIGDSSLKRIGSIHAQPIGIITTASNASPVVLEVTNHGLSTGTRVSLTGILGMSEINSQTYYISALTTNTVALYANSILSTPVNGTTYGTFTGTSTALLSRVLERHGNIAHGVDSASNLIDGRENVFFGHESGKNLTTGSYNIIIGHNIIPELTTGSGIISIGGDSIVNGLDNQVNIGSVFYFDGTGYASVNAETTVGLGSRAEILSTGSFTTTSTVTGGLVVVGGAFIWDNLIVADTIEQKGTGTNYFSGSIVPTTSTVDLGSLAFPFRDLYLSGLTLYIGGIPISRPVPDQISIGTSTTQVNAGSLNITGGQQSTSTTTGALVVSGGIGVSGDITLDGSIRTTSTGTEVSFNTGTFNTVKINGLTQSISTETGALVVKGGVGIGGDLRVGGQFFAAGGLVLTTASFNNSFSEGADISITLNTASTIVIANTSTLQTVTTRGSTTTNRITILNNTNSTSTISGALVISGGIGVGGRITSESLRISDTVFDTEHVTTTTTATVIIDTFDSTEYRSSKYFVQVQSGTGGAAEFHIVELNLLVDNAGQTYRSEYGLITTNGELGAFDTTSTVNTVSLTFTPTAATSKTIKVLRTGIVI